MSTAATRRGYCRHAVEIEQRRLRAERSVWFHNTIYGGSYDENLAVWVRFYEFNCLSYHHIWLLRQVADSPWRRTELKRVWRHILERIARCQKPRLP